MIPTMTSFNPRTHTGCDKYICANQSYIPCFNPRTHTGCDVMDILSSKTGYPFQSTHPHGVRLSSSLGSPAAWISFNPRTHTGCDGISLYVVAFRTVRFNPRTHTGCDSILFAYIHDSNVSIHAPTRGATPLWHP